MIDLISIGTMAYVGAGNLSWILTCLVGLVLADLARRLVYRCAQDVIEILLRVDGLRRDRAAAGAYLAQLETNAGKVKAIAAEAAAARDSLLLDIGLLAKHQTAIEIETVQNG